VSQFDGGIVVARPHCVRVRVEALSSGQRVVGAVIWTFDNIEDRIEVVEEPGDVVGDDHLPINGHRDRRWVANVRRDPRVSLVVHDQAAYLHYVSIRGPRRSWTRVSGRSQRR
jgi:hypothetical protein